MHLKRVVVALILVPVFYFCVMRLPSEFFLFLIAFFSTVALMEFYSMFRITGALKYAGLFCGGSLLLVYYMAGHLFVDSLLLSVLLILGLRLFIKRDAASSLAETSATILGLLYIPSLLSFQLALVKAGPSLIVLLYASVWASDSAAYYVGKGIGKRKLYKEISPNKTVEGAIGSVFGGAVAASLIKTFLMPQIRIEQAIVLGLAVGITTIVGDLVESMFKRDAGIKDSGTIIPGHGGVLDKIDGVTFAGPVFYWLCRTMGIVG